MSYDQSILRRIVEGALLAAGEALTVERLIGLFEENQRPEKKELVEALTSLQQESKGRGFELIEVASGWRYQVAHDLAYWVNRLWEEKPQKYSRALLETLSLIAYRQPITRSDIEEVRGVAVSSHIIKTLAEREWVKVVGHRDVPGRPALYATTRQFLDYFGLKSLDELPTLGELKDIDSLNESLELDEAAQEQEQIAEAQNEDGDFEREGEASAEVEPPQDDAAVKAEGSAEHEELPANDSNATQAIDVDEQPLVQEVATTPLSAEDEVHQHNREHVDAAPPEPDAEDVRAAKAGIHVDEEPEIQEVATTALSLEEQVAELNEDKVDEPENVATLADEVGADAEESDEHSANQQRPGRAGGSIFDASDAQGNAAAPNERPSNNDADDQPEK